MGLPLVTASQVAGGDAPPAVHSSASSFTAVEYARLSAEIAEDERARRVRQATLGARLGFYWAYVRDSVGYMLVSSE